MVHTHQSKPVSRRAFSLIETVISLSIVSVLFLGLSGAVMIGSHAIPTATETGSVDRAVIEGLSVLRSELKQAEAIHYNWTASDFHLHLTMDQSRIKGTPEEIQYHYRVDAKTFTRMYKEGSNLGTEYILFEEMTDGVFSVTEDGTDATALWMLITVEGTIQTTFELNILLPGKPVLDKNAGSK